MQNGVNICTNDSELNVIYGMMNLRKERELARASVRYIFTDLNDIRSNYFKLGFHLNEFKKMKYYEDFGYATMEEFCEKNLGLDKTAVSRCINVCLEFSQKESYIGSLKKGEYLLAVDDLWSKYSYSQLVEMIPLSVEQRRMVKPEMSIRQIRELKRSLKKSHLSEADFKFLDDAIAKSKNTVATSQHEVKYSHTYCSGISGAVRNQYYKKVIGRSIDLDVVDANGKSVDGLYNIKVDLLHDESDHIVIRLHTCQE